jgi:hypothetical protein
VTVAAPGAWTARGFEPPLAKGEAVGLSELAVSEGRCGAACGLPGRTRAYGDRRAIDRGLPVPLAGVVVPLPRLEPALDLDELTLRQELAGDLDRARST